MDLRALPPLNAMRAFLAFHQAGSMAAAGAMLNVSHAAISQQIKALEAHMGIPLLDRRARSTVLTTSGLELAEALDRGLGDVQRVVESLTGGAAQRPLQISTTPSFASGWLMPRLGDFRARHPEVSLMIDPSAEVKTLSPGGIDIAIRHGRGDWPGHECQLIVPSPVVLVAAPELVADKRDPEPEDLLDLPWLQELGTHECSGWLRRKGITSDPTFGISSMPGNLMIESLRAGQGIGVAARALIEPDITAGRLKVLFEEDSTAGYFAVTRPGVMRPPLKTFLRWLVRQSGQ